MNHLPDPPMERGLGHSLFLTDARYNSFENNSLNSYWLAPLWTLYNVFNSHWVKTLNSQSAPTKELTSYSDCFIVLFSWAMPQEHSNLTGLPNSQSPYKTSSSILGLTFTDPPRKMPFIMSCFCCLSNYSFAEVHTKENDSIKDLQLSLKSLELWKHG